MIRIHREAAREKLRENFDQIERGVRALAEVLELEFEETAREAAPWGMQKLARSVVSRVYDNIERERLQDLLDSLAKDAGLNARPL